MNAARGRNVSKERARRRSTAQMQFSGTLGTVRPEFSIAPHRAGWFRGSAHPSQSPRETAPLTRRSWDEFAGHRDKGGGAKLLCIQRGSSHCFGDGFELKGDRTRSGLVTLERVNVVTYRAGKG